MARESGRPRRDARSPSPSPSPGSTSYRGGKRAALRRAGSRAKDSVKAAGKRASGAISAAATKAAELKREKLITRTVWGLIMFVYLNLILWGGHAWIIMNVFLAQMEIFREMVNVRYDNRREDPPFFRSLQWAWFFVAVVYFYGEVVIKVMAINSADGSLDGRTEQDYEFLHMRLVFLSYSIVFVMTVLSMKKKMYRYQMNQLAWTLLTLVMVVAQLQSVILNVFAGIFWFVIPTMLVIINDTMAYFCGRSLGRQLVDHEKHPFLKLSPNKTWEGFVGGGLCTIVVAFFLPLLFVDSPWFVCPPNELSLMGLQPLNCTFSAEFLPQTYKVPVGGPFTAIPELIGMPQAMHVYSPEDLAAWRGSLGIAFRLIPEWETSFSCYPVQLYCILLGAFASLVAPFGGFFASAIKRAYDAKDFDTFIPGHGGLMDRLDCQFIMGLCTCTFCNTFWRVDRVNSGGGSEDALTRVCCADFAGVLAGARGLPFAEQEALLGQLTAIVASGGS